MAPPPYNNETATMANHIIEFFTRHPLDSEIDTLTTHSSLEYAYQSFQDQQDIDPNTTLQSFMSTLRLLNNTTHSVMATTAAKGRRATANTTLARYPDRWPLCQHLAHQILSPSTALPSRPFLIASLTTALADQTRHLAAARTRDDANALIAAHALDRATASSPHLANSLYDALSASEPLLPPHEHTSRLLDLNTRTARMLAALDAERSRYWANITLLQRAVAEKRAEHGWGDEGADLLAEREGAGLGDFALEFGGGGDRYLVQLESFWRKWVGVTLDRKRVWEEEWCYVSGRRLRLE